MIGGTTSQTLLETGVDGGTSVGLAVGPLKEGRGEVALLRGWCDSLVRWMQHCVHELSSNGIAGVSTDIGENPNSDAICSNRSAGVSTDIGENPNSDAIWSNRSAGVSTDIGENPHSDAIC